MDTGSCGLSGCLFLRKDVANPLLPTRIVYPTYRDTDIAYRTVLVYRLKSNKNILLIALQTLLPSIQYSVEYHLDFFRNNSPIFQLLREDIATISTRVCFIARRFVTQLGELEYRNVDVPVQRSTISIMEHWTN